MNKTSKRFIGIGSIILAVIFLLLAVVTPGEAQRTFAISGAPGVYRMCCYVPGKFEELIVEDEMEVQLAGTEEFEKGTILQLEMRLKKVEIWGETFRVRYKFNGKGSFEKVKLPETLESVKWVTEYPISVKQEKEYWCATTTKKRIFTDWIAETDDQILELPAIGLAEGAVLFLLTLIMFVVEVRLIEKHNRKQNQKYPRLLELTEEYIHEHWLQEGSREYAQWIHKKKKHMDWFRCIVVLGLPLFLVLTWTWGTPKWILGAILAGMLCMLALVIYSLKLCLDIVKLTDKGVHPTDCIWCWYRLMEDGDPKLRYWGIADMNLAVWMGKAGDYERSYEMAELIWAAFGKKEKGTQYLQYHLCQCRNVLYGGMLGDAAYHLEQMQRELNRGRYKKQKEKLLEIKEEFLEKLRELDTQLMNSERKDDFAGE